MNSFFHKGWRLYSAVPDAEAKQLFDLIQKGDIQVTEWLKRHSRSDVVAFNFNGKKLVLKIPKEKNRRRWIRLTTLYRKSEAVRNINSMEILRREEIPTSTPVMAAEKKTFGMVTDSWLVYEYLEGESCLDKPSIYPQVVKLLHQIHDSGLIHSDPQIRNFIIHDGGLFVIDSMPSKPFFGPFAKAYEFAYLKKSAPGIESCFGEMNHSLWFKAAVKYDRYARKLATFKKKVKKALFRRDL